MTDPPPERTLIYAADLTAEDVRALETFLNAQLGRVSEGVGETGETFFAMRSLLILVSDSAGFCTNSSRWSGPSRGSGLRSCVSGSGSAALPSTSTTATATTTTAGGSRYGTTTPPTKPPSWSESATSPPCIPGRTMKLTRARRMSETLRPLPVEPPDQSGPAELKAYRRASVPTGATVAPRGPAWAVSKTKVCEARWQASLKGV